MELVTEKTEVKIGKFYLVNCAKIKSARFNTIMFVPIIGKLHADPQFNVTENHYHVDGRFNSCPEYKTDCFGRTNKVVSTQRYFGDEFLEIEVKKMKCKGLITGINPGDNKTYWKWYGGMLGKSCKGKRCPHLGTVMSELNGKLVCPLHGLVGDIKTKKIIHESYMPTTPKEVTFLETMEP